MEVHQHHPGKAQNTPQRFVIAEFVVVVDKVRQQHAEEGPGGIHDGAVHPGRVGQADIKEGVLEGGLGQSEDRELAKLRGREPANRFSLGQGKKQQQRAGKQKTVSGKDDFGGDIIGRDLKEFVATFNGRVRASPKQTAERGAGIGHISTGKDGRGQSSIHDKSHK